MTLEIQGGHRHQLPSPPQAEVAPLPALAGHDAGAGLELLQPAPAVEGQTLGMGSGQQGVPTELGDRGEALVPAGLQLSHGRQNGR